MRRAFVLLGVAVAGAGGLALLGPGGPFSLVGRSEPAPVPTHAVLGRGIAPGDLPGRIAAAQARLRDQPKDAQTWAMLGTDYIEQARLTADPSYYTRAEGALKKSLEHGENADALIGMGALANARHEFAQGRDWARKAQRANPERWPLYGVLADAYLELGDYDRAEQALQRLLDTRPGLAAFVRAGHLLALYGKADRAKRALQMALDAAITPVDVAFCQYRLGELAFGRGRTREALDAYEAALAADTTYTPALAGRGRTLAALGRTDEAIRDYTAATAKTPHPPLVLELGELYQSLGWADQARRQFEVFLATQRLFAASGVADDLALGIYEADHGSPASAVRHLQAEWARRSSVDVADALGWALHRAGRFAEARGYAEKAERLGGQNALFAYHRAEISRALGETGAARAGLRRALRINPHFPRAAQARSALASLR